MCCKVDRGNKKRLQRHQAFITYLYSNTKQNKMKEGINHDKQRIRNQN